MAYAETLIPSSSSSAFLITGFLGALVLLWLIATREATPLRKIPGPFLASITKLWVVQKQREYKRPLVDIELHKKYGPIVRVAPNEVLISSPEAFRTVYRSKFGKGEWYTGTGSCGWDGPDNLNLLAEYNIQKYRVQRRAVGPAYSEAAMKDMEPQLDSILEKDIRIMRERSGEPVDLDMFFNMIASDCYATLTFGTCMDLVERNEVDGSIHAIHKAWKYTGYFPLFHRAVTAVTKTVVRYGGVVNMLMARFPFLTGVSRMNRSSKDENVHPFAFPLGQIKSRLDARATSSIDPKAQDYPNDIAGKLFQLQADKGTLKDHWVRSICMTNFGAGIETTAIVISTLINYIVSHPGCQEKVQAELDKARKEGKIESIPGARDMKEHLPYLNACLMEAMRLHPVVGMPLVRVVPEGGVELEGKWLPAGTTVGVNSWVLCRNKDLYGEDADEWRPERWLEYNSEKLKYLGARSCPGKNLAQTVYRKMIPMLFQDMEWSFVDLNAEKVLQCTFSVRYIKMMMKWKLREQTV